MDEEKSDVVIDVPERHKVGRAMSPSSQTASPSFTFSIDEPTSPTSESDEGPPEPLKDIDYYIQRRKSLRKEPISSQALEDGEDERVSIIEDMLSRYVEPASVVQGLTCEVLNSRSTLDELRASYSGICQTVVEFEHKISTLRANSKSESLTLAHALVTRISTRLFKMLRDFRPRPRPELHLNDAAKERKRQWLANNQDSPDSFLEAVVSIWREQRSRGRIIGIGGRLVSIIFPREHLVPVDVRMTSSERAQYVEISRGWERELLRLQMLGRARKLVSGENDSLTAKLGSMLTSLFSIKANSRRFMRLGLLEPPRLRLEDDDDEETLQRFERRIPQEVPWGPHRLAAQSVFKQRQEDWAFDWTWDLDWDREWGLDEEREWQRARAQRWIETYDWPPKDEPDERSQEIGDWILRTRKEIAWLKQDRASFPDDWDEEEWVMQQLWWNDVETWLKRWAERKHAVDDFSKTCEALVKELGNIDGGALTRELNVFRGSDSTRSLEEHQLVIRYVANMRDAFTNNDKELFMGSCNSIFRIIDEKVRSDRVEKGLELLIKKQDHYRNSFMDFATVAIFFSSITATTLQFSFTSADSTALSTIVNICWFSSLVLSIASATNSFVGAIVHQSTDFLRPSQNLDRRFLQKWFKFTPSSLLAFSGALFLTGLCAFTFTSTMQIPSQGKITQFITLSFTSSNFLALSIMLLLTFTRVIHVSLRIGFTIVAVILIFVLQTTAISLGVAVGAVVVAICIPILVAFGLFVLFEWVREYLSFISCWHRSSRNSSGARH